MRTILIRLCLLSIIIFTKQSRAQTIQVRFPDTSAVVGAVLDVPVYVDSSLTGKGILSYQFKMDYSSYYADVLGVITTGTLSSGFAAPSYIANTAANTITISSAGANVLAGVGVLFKIRIQVKQAGGFYFGFNGGVNNNFFNQGSPVLTFKPGLLSITNPPTIQTYFASSVPLTIGDSVQVYVNGGTSPYTYTVVDPAVATITTSGMLKSIGIGKTKVVAQSANNIIDTTDVDIEVRALKVSIPDTTILPLSNMIMPLRINTTTSSAILSGSFRINYAASYMIPDSIITTGTLLQGAVVSYQNYNGFTIFSFAGSVPLTGAGDLIKVRFKILNPVSSYLSLQDVFFNQTIIANRKDGSLFFTPIPTLSVSPNYGEYYIGDSQQFTPSGGKPPYTFAVTDAAKASITTTGLFSAKSGGMVKVKITDSLNTIVHTSDLQVYDAQLVLPSMGVLSGSSIICPVFIAKTTGAKPLYSVQFTVTFPANTLDSVEAVLTNTLASGWTVTQNVLSNKIIIAIAGTTPINANGMLLKLKAKILSSNTVGTNISLSVSDVLFNEANFYTKTISGNLNVVAVLQKDIGINTVIGLSSSCNKGAQDIISASIYNYNNVSYYIGDTLFVGYILNGGTPVRDTVVLASTLNQNSAVLFSFKQKANLSAVGVYSLKVFTQLPGDINMVNDTNAITFQVYGTPVVSLGNDTAICSGTTLPLNATSSAATYLWSTGLTTPSIGVDSTGTYWVKVTNGFGCFVYDSVSVSLKPKPAITNLSGSPYSSVCGLDSIVLATPGISGGKYRWLLNGVNTLNNGDTLNQFTVKTGGTYTVKVTNSLGCSSMMPDTTIVLATSRQSAPTISGNVTVCEGDSLALNASALSNASYMWSGANGFVAATQHIKLMNVSAVNAGVYKVYAIKNGATVTCDTSIAISVLVEVNTRPTVKSLQLTGSTSLCNGDSVLLFTDNVAGNQYRWYKNGGALSTDTMSQLSVKTTGTYTVKVTNTTGCSAFMRDTMVAVSTKLGAPNITGASILCEGDTLVLATDSVTNVSYKWTGPNAFSAFSRTIKIPTIGIAGGGDYIVFLLRNGATNSCDTSTVVQKNVTVNNKPVVVALTLTGNNTFCQGDSTHIAAPAISGNTYSWLRNNINMNDTTTAVVVKQSGTYNVKMTNSAGCSALMQPVQITVNPKPITSAISGLGTVLINTAQSYQVNATASSVYNWFVTNGIQNTGGTSNSITVQWSTIPAVGILKVLETTALGCRGDTVSKQVTILSSIPDSLILGIDSVVISNQAYVNKVGIYSNVTWSVSNPVSWITVSPLSGIGSDSITLSVAANTDSLSRSAIITITAGSITKQIKVIQSGNVGLNDYRMELSNVLAYPNPTTDWLYIENNGPVELSVFVIDMLGHVSITERSKTSTTSIVDCSELNPGFYVLKLIDEKGRQKNIRLIIQ